MRPSDNLSFAIPTTVVREPDLVRLIAGEDFRFTLRGSQLETWLPAVLEQLDGRTSIAAVLRVLPPTRHAEALALLERLVSERLLFAADTLPETSNASVSAEGAGRLFECVKGMQASTSAAERVRTLCQDTLDYRAALKFNESCRAGNLPWLWATLGPSARAFVSPVFWPDLGPCIACLLEGFERLSPAPELYPALVAHAERGGEFRPARLPAHALTIVANLIHGKVAMLGELEPPAAVLRLHVVEVATLEVTAHRIPRDLECRVCMGAAEAALR